MFGCALMEDRLQKYHIDKAFESYAEGKISLQKAARMAGITYREALEELKRRSIPFRYEKEDLDADVKRAAQY